MMIPVVLMYGPDGELIDTYNRFGDHPLCPDVEHAMKYARSLRRADRWIEVVEFTHEGRLALCMKLERQPGSRRIRSMLEYERRRIWPES